MGQPDLAVNERNFLYIHLGDNDFGWQLNNAATTLLLEYGYTNAIKPEAWTLAVVSLVNAYCIARDAEYITGKGYKGIWSVQNATIDYLSQHVSSQYRKSAPRVDDSGGSVVVDFNLRTVWNT